MLQFGITADGQFFLKFGIEALQNHEMHNVPLLTGFNNDEGGWLIANVS